VGFAALPGQPSWAGPPAGLGGKPPVSKRRALSKAEGTEISWTDSTFSRLREKLTMRKRYQSKEQHRENLLQYLGNPENEWPNRQRLSTEVMGFAHENGIYKVFDLDEIYDIEMAALDLRRKKYSRLVGLVDLALLKKAAEGDTAAAKLVYQRFENWNEKHSFDQNVGIEIQIVRFTDSDAEPIPVGGRAVKAIE
jgi:hypothetical protein